MTTSTKLAHDPANIVRYPEKRPDADRLTMRRLWRDGIERGERMVRFLGEQLDRPLSELRVLEIGTGGGGIAIAFARHVKSLVSADVFAETLSEVADREDYQAAPFSLVQLDAISLPFADQSFDLVLLNGVLEYMGCRQGSHTPMEYQEHTLREINRVLAPGGCLYLGIENRWYPKRVFGDPHTRQPLVCVLPRRLADWYSRWRNGTPYRHWIHSLGGLRRMLRTAAFDEIRPYIALVSYQFPREIVPVSARWELIRGLSGRKSPVSDEFRRCTSISWRGKLFLAATAILGLQAQLANCFIVLAIKDGQK